MKDDGISNFVMDIKAMVSRSGRFSSRFRVENRGPLLLAGVLSVWCAGSPSGSVGENS